MTCTCKSYVYTYHICRWSYIYIGPNVHGLDEFYWILINARIQSRVLQIPARTWSSIHRFSNFSRSIDIEPICKLQNFNSFTAWYLDTTMARLSPDVHALYRRSYMHAYAYTYEVSTALASQSSRFQKLSSRVQWTNRRGILDNHRGTGRPIEWLRWMRRAA